MTLKDKPTEFSFNQIEYQKLEYQLLKARQEIAKGDKTSADQHIKHALEIMQADAMRFYDKNVNPYNGIKEKEDLNEYFG